MANLWVEPIGLYARRRLAQIKSIHKFPSEIQRSTLNFIIRKQKDTAWGKHHGYNDIKDVSQFQKRLPLHRYLDIKPWIDRCLEGQPDILWPGRIRYFAVTSGTTAKNKYIPITNEAIRSNRKAALDCLAIYIAQKRRKTLFKGHFLFLGGSPSLRKEKNIYVGDLSGIMSKHAPFYVNKFYEPSREIAAINDWEAKLERIAQEYKDKDIRAISGIPSWIHVLFNRLLDITGKRTMKEIWPNLELLIHGGVDFRPYRNLFRDFLGKDVYFMETYPASEGFIAIQQDQADPALSLMPDYGIFYEFVPVEEFYNNSPNKKRLTLDEAETGKNYAIVLTTNSGLSSYVLGDTVKLVSKIPPKIVVTGRIESFLNAFGEHVIVEELESAISAASSQTGAEIADYTVAPFFSDDRGKLSSHIWLVEFNKLPKDLNRFSEILDNILCERNDDYKAHRQKRLGISLPQVVTLPRSTFYQWLKLENRLGGQSKVPRILTQNGKLMFILDISRRLQMGNC